MVGWHGHNLSRLAPPPRGSALAYAYLLSLNKQTHTISITPQQCAPTSGVWKFSRMAQMVRVQAHSVELSMCTYFFVSCERMAGVV